MFPVKQKQSYWKKLKKEPGYQLFVNEQTSEQTPTMTNSEATSKKKGLFTTLRGYFKSRKSSSWNDGIREFDTSIEVTCSSDTPVGSDEYDMNPALDPIAKFGRVACPQLSFSPLKSVNCLSSFPKTPDVSRSEREHVYPEDTPEYINLGNCDLKSILTDFDTKTSDDAFGYVNLGFIGKTTASSSSEKPNSNTISTSVGISSMRPQLTRQNAIVSNMSNVPFDVQWEKMDTKNDKREDDTFGGKF